MLLSPSRIALCLLFLFTFAFSLSAQDLDNVTISGKVTDSNGAPIAGATVIATESQTGAKRNVTSNEEGRYLIVNLKPGLYTVQTNSSGFGTKQKADLFTIAGQAIQLDFQLAPAGVSAETTVAASGDDAAAVDTTRTVVGSTITSREIEELPNPSRNPLDLVLTLGGTTEEALSTKDLAEDRNSNPRSTPLENGNFSLSGGAAYSNNITIDGFDNNDDRSARDRFQPSLEAVQEVQVIRNQFSAEYGRASGGRVNLLLRSGTNKFRGRAYMFFRDDNLNSNSWYNNSRNIARLPFTDYNPGFLLSGPIVLPKVYDGHDRTFFSVSYEYDNFRDTTLIDTWIPLTPNTRFTLPNPNGTDQRCDAPSSPPAPCAAGVGAIAQYTSLLPTPNRSHILTTKIDHKLFDSNNLTFGFQFGRRKNQRTTGTSVTRIEDALQAKDIDTDAFNILDSQTVGSSIVNEARFQWSRYQPAYVTNNPLDPVVLIGYRNPISNSVQTLIAGNSTASTLQNFADTRKETRFQIADSLTYVRGRHIFKVGGDAQHVNSKATDLGDATGTYNFSSVFTYSGNTLSRYRQNFGTASDVTNTYWALFYNDQMRLKPNLTMTYGLRYERETAVSDNNNFGPRFGLAWDPFKKGKGVIRFGAAVVYNRVLLRTVGDFIQNNLGGLQSFDSNSIQTSGNWRTNILASIAQDFPNGYPSVDALRSAISRASCGASSCNPNTGFLVNSGNASNPLRSIDPDLKIPESYQFNVGFERVIAKGFVFEANYTLNKTVHLWREYNPNVPIVPAGFSDLTAWLVAHPFTFTNANGTLRNYVFYQGTDGVTSGLSTAPNGATACPTSGASNIFTVGGTCFVNLNTLNNSTTTPATNASDGVSSNSIGAPIGIALEAVRPLRPNPNFDEMERVLSIGNSFYQGLVLEIRSRFRQIGAGFRSSFRVAYTLSRLKDDGLNNTTNAEINGDFGREWARANQDRLHRITVSGTFETPSWMGKLRYSPIFRFGSSAPFNLGIGADRNLNDVSTDRLNFSGDLSDIRWREPGTPFPTELASRFTLQPIGSAGGNLPRNAGRGPNLYIFDLNVSREWKFSDRFRLRPTVEFGNILNAAVFSFGSEFVDFFSNPTALQQSTFLVPSRTYRQRDIKLGIRFEF
jgi:hypothetical protein